MHKKIILFGFIISLFILIIPGRPVLAQANWIETWQEEIVENAMISSKPTVTVPVNKLTKNILDTYIKEHLVDVYNVKSYKITYANNKNFLVSIIYNPIPKENPDVILNSKEELKQWLRNDATTNLAKHELWFLFGNNKLDKNNENATIIKAPFIKKYEDLAAIIKEIKFVSLEDKENINSVQKTGKVIADFAFNDAVHPSIEECGYSTYKRQLIISVVVNKFVDKDRYNAIYQVFTAEILKKYPKSESKDVEAISKRQAEQCYELDRLFGKYVEYDLYNPNFKEYFKSPEVAKVKISSGEKIRFVCQYYADAADIVMYQLGIKCFVLALDSTNHALNAIVLANGSVYTSDYTMSAGEILLGTSEAGRYVITGDASYDVYKQYVLKGMLPFQKYRYSFEMSYERYNELYLETRYEFYCNDVEQGEGYPELTYDQYLEKYYKTDADGYHVLYYYDKEGCTGIDDDFEDWKQDQIDSTKERCEREGISEYNK